MNDVREPVGEVVRGLEGLDEETSDQVEGVDAGQRAQQPVGGAGAVLQVAAQDGDRHGVAEETDEAEQTDDVNVEENALPGVVGRAARAADVDERHG